MPGPQGIPQDIPIVLRSWYGRQAPEASVVGDQLKFNFVAQVSAILGDVRLFFMPDSADTTTNTDLSRHGATLTYDASVAGNLNRQGSGLFWQLDGSADETDTADNARYTFLDGVDEPFSIVALINPDVNNAAMSILAKQSSATAEEYDFGLTSSGHPFFTLTDESESATIGRRDATAVGTNAVLVAGTYDGTATSSGIDVLVNAVVLDDNDVNTGSYTAMEDTAAILNVGARYSTKQRFFDGGIAMVTLSLGALSVHEVEAILGLVNGYFDLSL